MADLFNDPELLAAQQNPQQAPISLFDDPELQEAQQQSQFQQIQEEKAFQEKLAQIDVDQRRKTAEETGTFETIGAQMFRSFPKVGRSLQEFTEFATGGLIDFDDVAIAKARAQDERRFAPLSKANPIASFVGRTAGDIAATAPIGGPIAAGVKGAAGRFVAPKLAGLSAAAAAGAIEESLVEGNPLLGAAFGVGGELVLPIVGKAIRDSYRKLRGVEPDLLPNGTLSPSSVQELENAGFNLSDLGRDVEQILLERFDPEESLQGQVRRAEANIFDTNLTSGQASQTRELQSLESGALRSRDALADEANAIMSQQQLDLIGGADRQLIKPLGSNLVTRLQDRGDNLNVGAAGDAVRTHFRARKVLSSKNVEALYKAAQDIDGADIPLDASGMISAMLSRGDSASDEINKTIRKILAKNGVIGKELTNEGDGVFSVVVGGDRVKFSKEPKELTLDTMDGMRKELNKISPKDATDAAFVQQIKRELDNSVGEAVDFIPEGAPKKEAIEKARAAYSNLKKTYEDSDFVESLLSYKDNKSLIPQIPDSEIIGKLFRGNRSTQNLKRIKGLLLTHKNGKDVWNDIRAVSAEELLKGSMTKKIQSGTGETTAIFSSANFKNKLDQMGREKFELLFNDVERKSFKRFQRVLGNIDIPLSNVSSSSGSGEVAENAAYNLMSRLAKMTLLNRGTGAVDLADSAIRKNKLDILRTLELQKGLDSIRGKKMSPRTRSATTAAATQQYMQSLFESLTETVGGKGAISAAAGTNLVEGDQ